MLVLRRKKNESILIGNDIRITILECASDGIRIAIDAPKQISIIREELSQAELANKSAISPASSSVRSFQATCALPILTWQCSESSVGRGRVDV